MWNIDFKKVILNYHMADLVASFPYLLTALLENFSNKYFDTIILLFALYLASILRCQEISLDQEYSAKLNWVIVPLCFVSKLVHRVHTLLINDVYSTKAFHCSAKTGGCGACVVLLSKHDPILDQVEDFTVSSCLTLLCSLNGCSITTSEGLGNSKDGFHPIHERFAGFHASQCGFCTPGMCMSLF